MLIYLFALKEHGQTRYGRRLFPAGVLYVPAREEMESVPPGTSEEKIAELRAKGYDVATRVTAATTFWPAEEYHQDYYDRKGAQPYCHAYTKRF